MSIELLHAATLGSGGVPRFGEEVAKVIGPLADAIEAALEVKEPKRRRPPGMTARVHPTGTVDALAALPPRLRKRWPQPNA